MDNLPKIALVIGATPPPYGGGEIINDILVRWLSKESNFHIIHIDTSDKRGNDNRGKIDFTNVSKGLVDLIRLIICFLSIKPDIAYIPIAKGLLAFLRDSLYITCCSIFGVRVICHLHGGYFDLNEGSKLRQMYVNFTLRRVHSLLVLGEDIKLRLKERLPVQNLVVIYNGIDPVIQRRPAESEEEDGDFNILFIGNLKESKGVLDVLKAIPIVLRETDRVYFWFAGEWPSTHERDYTLELVSQSGISKYVKFWGLIKGQDKSEFFRQGNVLIHPTYYDGQPIVILEAMSAGLPIISTDVGSIAETVMDGENGFIIPPGRPDKIAEKILLLYRDKNLRTSMSAMSKKIYETRFTKEVFLNNVQRVFHQVCVGKPAHENDNGS